MTSRCWITILCEFRYLLASTSLFTFSRRLHEILTSPLTCVPHLKAVKLWLLSTINPDCSYVVPSTIDINGLTLTPPKTGLLKILNVSSKC
jgi:hypothetical protein